MKTRITVIVIIALAVLLPKLVLGKDMDAKVKQIAAEVRQRRSAINNVTFEYSLVRVPASAKPDDGKAAGLPETGKLIIQGDRIRLERTYYHPVSSTKPVTDYTVFDGEKTVHESGMPKTGLITAGRWHGFRTFFNPLMLLSVTGDADMDRELEKHEAVPQGQKDVAGSLCDMIKMAKRTASGAPVRTYEVAVNPQQRSSLKRVKKYFYDSDNLETALDVEEYQEKDGFVFPTRATLQKYTFPDKNGFNRVRMYENIVVRKITVNGSLPPDTFTHAFTAGTRVWDARGEVSFVASEPNQELD